MGTRGIWGMKKSGNLKATYSQYDAYPEGLGLEVVKFAKKAGTEKLNVIFDKLITITQDTCILDNNNNLLPEHQNFEKFKKYYQQVSTGIDAYAFFRGLQNNPQEYLKNEDLNIMAVCPVQIPFDEESWLEWGYIINLDENEIEIYDRRGEVVDLGLSNCLQDFCSFFKIDYEEEEEPETQKTLIKFDRNDLDYEICRRAYYWTSFDPERAGKREQDYYYEDLLYFCNEAEKRIITEEQKQKAIELLEQYKIKILEKRRAYLYANSNVASAGIAGPANFNYDRNNKKMATADKRYNEFAEYRQKFENILFKSLNDLKPQEVINNEKERVIDSNINSIANDILISKQPNCTFSLSLIRANFRQRLETIAKNNPDKIDYIINKIKEVEQDKGVVIFTKNNNIWDYFQKIKDQHSAPKETKESNSLTINGVNVVKNYEADRLQIFFDGKPNYEMISKLKKGAWRWSPSNKCWQRQLTDNAIWSAKRILEA